MSPVNGDNLQMAYDALGRRTSKTLMANPYYNVPTNYVHDGNGAIVSPTILSGNVALRGVDGAVLAYTSSNEIGNSYAGRVGNLKVAL